MAVKFDKLKVKHQLIHISLNLATILACMLYLQHGIWTQIGTFSGSVLPILFVGEILKLILTKYFGRYDREIISQQKERSRKKSLGTMLKDFLGSIALQLFCIILYAFVCIVLGAPVLQDYEQTFVLAILLAITTVSPIVMLFGVNGTLLICFCEKTDYLTKSEEIIVDLHKYHATGILLGGWAGSVVVPLDWDRDWQVYPIPNIVGALLGCGLFNMFACTKILFMTGRTFLKKRT